LILAKGTRIRVVCHNGHLERPELVTDLPLRSLSLDNLVYYTCKTCGASPRSFYLVLPGPTEEANTA